MTLKTSTLQFCAIIGLTTSAFAGGGATLIGLPDSHQPVSISADGSVVLGFFGSQFFQWTEANGVEYLGTFGNAGNPVISADGQVIAGTGPNGGVNDAAYWNGSSWDILPSLGFSCDASSSSGWGLNGDGSTLVGLAWVDGCRAHAARWDNMGAAQDLGSTVPGRSSRANGVSADTSVIYGWQDAESGFRQGAYWVDGVQTVIQKDTGGSVGEAQASTPSGSALTGGAYDSDAWRWTSSGDVAESIGGLTGFNFITNGADITDDGNTIVGWGGFGFDRDAFIWTADDGMELLLNWAAANGVDTTGWNDLMIATGVSADGRTIIGWGWGPDAFIQGFVMKLPTLCDADIDGDNVVGVDDLLAVLAAWGPCEDCPEDLNGSGAVDVDDLLELLAAWGDC